MLQQLSAYQQRVNKALDLFLTRHQIDYDPLLAEAIRYATLNNGKRIRPALIYAMGDALNIPLEKLDSSAVAIELMHSYSLVHDDLPAMDDDNLRRGQETCHIKYNEYTAILVGDAQQTLAYECLSNDKKLTDASKIKIIQLLSQASGAKGMIGGQFSDMQSAGILANLPELERMHNMKTGALIKAALLIGACQSELFCQKSPGVALFGDKIGLAFQVQDDIIDIESSTETLGKTAGKDQEENKSTYPKLLGLKSAKKLRNDLIASALAILKENQIDSPFLIELTKYISQRVK